MAFPLEYVHAFIYELDEDGAIDTETRIDTSETDETDEGICDLSPGIDTTFITVPRSFEPAVISVYSHASLGQSAEVVETVERTLAPVPDPPEIDDGE